MGVFTVREKKKYTSREVGNEIDIKFLLNVLMLE